MESSNCGVLPAEIIREILLRLPVKTLLRFKCVCKHWCSIIGNQSFTNEHFGHESNQERLLIRHFKSDEEGHVLALFADELCTAYEEPDHLQMPDGIAFLMGPVNGVFCVFNRSESMALLNPAMKQFKPLPSFHHNVQPDMSLYFNVEGFGLDSLSGNLKLVSLQYYWNEVTEEPPDPALISVNVYGSGTNSWRHFEDVDLVNSSCCPNVSLCNMYLNGSYYWLCRFNVGDDGSILAFDMAIEKFREIKVPSDCFKYEGGSYLTVYSDKIALLSCEVFEPDRIVKSINIWVMEKEGCWIKSSTVGPFVDFRLPMGFWKNELLLETDSTLLTLYNVSTKISRNVQLGRKVPGFFRGFFRYWVFYYKESLVSLKGEEGYCKLWDTSSDFIKDFCK